MFYRHSLRTASILSIVHALMHQVGMMVKPTDASEIALVSSMSEYQVKIMGSMRSYMDFYSGLGLFLTITLISFGIVFWQMSNAIDRQLQAMRPLLLTMGLTYLVFAAASVRYFFIAPIAMETAISALVFLAYFKSRHVA